MTAGALTTRSADTNCGVLLLLTGATVGVARISTTSWNSSTTIPMFELCGWSAIIGARSGFCA